MLIFLSLAVLLLGSYLFLKRKIESSNEPLITIGTNTWLGYEILYLAREKGFLPENIKIVEYNSTSEVKRAYKNGLINALALTLDEALRLHEEGYPIVIVLVFDFSEGADVVISREKIRDSKDIVGKRIGVEKTAFGWYMLNRFLDKYGLQEKDVYIKIIEAHEHYSAFVNGDVDIVVTFEPNRGKIVKRGGYVVFTSSEIRGEIVDLLVVDESLLKHKEALIGLLRAYFNAYDYFTKNQDEAIYLMTKREKVSSEEIKKALEGIRFPGKMEQYEIFKKDSLQPILNKVCDFMKTKEMLKVNTDCNSLLKTNIVREIYDSID